MEYTIREMIALKGRALEETDYALSNPAMLDFRLFSSRLFPDDFYEWDGGKLRFKECVDVMDFEQTAEAFPPFEKIKFKSRKKFPYFTDNLDTLMAARERGEVVAVEGGPCLFGENEVIVEARLKSGEARLFDYASGEACPEKKTGNAGETAPPKADVSKRETLAGYLRQYSGEVEQILFLREKEGLTPQEYLNLRYPFEIAAALGGPLVISIPDMSYRKYLTAMLEFVPEALRNRTLAEYDAITERILAFYLDAVEKLRARFQIAPFACVHGGNREALEIWYGKRAPYIERRRFLRHLTQIPEKTEAVKDYVSMPALPYYLFGAENILEMNNVTETDSCQKCKSAHKQAIRLGCLLLPHLLSKDGVHTFYNGPLEWKEFGNYDNALFEGA